MAASDAVAQITSATHGGTALGFVQSWSWRYAPNDIPVVGEGKTGIQAICTVGETVIVTINFLNAPFIAPTTAPATIVLTGKDSLGNPDVTTIIQMKPRGIGHEGQVQGLHIWSQEFMYIGDMAVFPITHT